MKTITLKLRFLLVFLLISLPGIAQEVYPTVGIVGTATPNSNWESSVPMELLYADKPHQWVLNVQLTQGEMKFRANDNWTVNWGSSDYPKGTGYQNGPNITIPETGFYTIYFNSSTGAYLFALDPPVYGTVGIRGDATTSGWGISVPMTVNPKDPHSWFLESITLTANEFKFLANNNWDLSWGGNSFPTGTGDRWANNIKVTTAGEYSVTFNDVTGEYIFEILNAPTYETVGIIGDATAKGWEASTPMNLVAGTQHDWILTTYLSVGELKFRANDSWDMNWGAGDFPKGTATYNSGNLVIPESGYFTIRFNDSSGDYIFTKENPIAYNSVGIVGSATPGAWDNSTAMQKGADGHTWTLDNFELTAGEVKFRVDNKWDMNWGGTEFPTGMAVINAPNNIPVTPGFYDISFNDFTREYYFELVGSASGGIVTLDPAFPTAEEQVTITYDATKGVSGLKDAAKVYMHSGVVFSGPEGTAWNNVVGNWGRDDGVGEMTAVAGEPGKWQITLSSIREYYSVEAGVPVFRLGMVFRSADGTKIGKSETDGDIFVNVDPGDYVRFTAPVASEIFGIAGDQLQLSAEASGVAENISIEINSGSGFQPIAQVSNSERISFLYALSTSGEIQLRVTAQIGGKTVSSEKTISVYLRRPNTVAALPEGMKNGINYDPADASKATLVLLATQKEFVYLMGDFNNWQISDTYQMNQTPDGETYWLELTGLEAQKEYVYQYWVEGTIKIGDPYADKVADPWSDGNIPAHVYPNPVSYNKTQYGIATVLQTGQQPYQWNFPEVVGGRPANEDLVIYELLVRDFVDSHSYREVIEKLPYLKSLGVNAIELLPVMEYENNESWGYNPTYLFAPDKYYGSKNDLKAFIDKAHEMGMVVLLDMVLNHQFGQSPMVQMYFDKTNNKPASNSPWFNPDATHPFNVGYDMNHESQYTKNYIDDVNRYWIEEFKFDGYRFDLSKGFTQKNNPDDVGAWSAYDQSRIDILKRMSDVIWDTDAGAYVIMEHLADNSEEKVLADYGIMLWGNMNHHYGEVVLGNTAENLSWTLSSTRGWNEKNLVSYMESHDEERLMVKALNHGMSSGDYNINQPETALERVKLASAFYYTVPGPKMIWQFGELGYDYPIDYNGRTGNKPIPWSGADGLAYDQDESRMKLYRTKAAMINLVNAYPDVFEEGQFSWTPTGQIRTISINHEVMNVKIIGNFGVTAGNAEVNFPETGTWYDFYSGQKFVVNATANTIALSPGEFHILVDMPVDFPVADLTVNTFVFMTTPTALDAELTEPFSIAVTWKDNSAGELGYVVERKAEDDSEFIAVATVAENVEEYLDTTVLDGVTYEYRVKAISTSAGDSGWSNTDVVDLPLLAPSGLNAVLADARSVALHWQDRSAHESAYTVERAMENGSIRTSFEAVAILTPNSQTFTDTQLRTGMTYYYRVVAKDSDEVSDYSNIVSIRPADGLKDQLTKSISMSPNPASHVVNISTTLQLSLAARFQIVNLQGNVVQTFQLEPGTQSVLIDVNSLRNGIYIVHEINSESSFGKLLMINR